MHRMIVRLLAGVVLLTLLGPVAPVPAVAAPAVPPDTGVYEEDFSTYSYKDYVENTEWDIWAHTLRLARPDAISQDSPAIATDGSGNTVVVWEDDRNGDSDIYAQKLDANGNRLWVTDVRINSDSGVADQWYPAVAMDENGNAIVVWEDYRNGNLDIYAQRLDASGNRLWTVGVRVNSDGGTKSQGNPAVAMDTGGNAVVVWRDSRSGKSDIYGQKLDRNGSKLWAVDVRVNSDSGTASQLYPAVAVDRSGNAVVVWRDDRNGDSDAYAQRLDGSGNKVWAVDVRVNSDSGTGCQGDSAVAMDGGGNAVVVWSDDRNGHDDIYAQKLNGNGGKLWTVDVRINSDSRIASRFAPAVAVDRSGNVIIVWEDHNSGHGEICAQRLDPSGNWLWAANVRVNSDSGTAGQWCPAVVVVEDGNAVVVWYDSPNGNRDICTQKLDASGSKLWAADVRVNGDSGAAYQREAVVAIDGDEDGIVVWEDGRSGAQDIFAQRLDGSGNQLWAADVRVHSDSGTAYWNGHAVAMDGSGNAIVVWSDDREGSDNIYAQRLDASGNKLWSADVRVSSYSGVAWQHRPAVAMDGSGNVIVVWEDCRNQCGDVYAQRLDRSGNRLWVDDVRVNSDSGTAVQFWPAVSVDGGGNAVVVWLYLQSGTTDIYAQKLDGSGSQLWAVDTRVNSDGGTADRRDPTVVVDKNGHAVIVWDDEPNGNKDIYAQKLDGSGSKLWTADVRVNSDSGTASQYDPVVAIDESGNAFLVWEDYRNGDADIYGQRLDGHGTKLWPVDIPVNSDGGAVDHIHPAVALDENGNAIVVWMDLRNGNADIYAQKINSVGSQVWLADLQMVYPDRFYLPTGTVQSRTVDSVTGNIRSATLTANYQTNSGGVQFYLTNDGGAHWVTTTLGAATLFTTTGSDLRWRAVLSVDPIWHRRTPVVNSLRIEYSTQVPYADDYEPDDGCLFQAHPIAANGAVQAHTFHQEGDADWVWFDVISGTTYIVETYNLGTRAQTVAEPHRTCDAPPAGTGRPFGNGYTFSFTAAQTGRYYVKVYNHTPSVYGQDTDYTLSVRAVRPSAVAIVVAGHDGANSYQDNILYAADRAYRVFLNAGLGKANVRYLAPLANHDADGDGVNDVAGLSTPANVRDAVQDWARERGVALGVPLYVYLVDHGLVDRFKTDGNALANHVTAGDLNLWLSNLEATTGADNVNVILDACYSGSFIDVTGAGPATISGRNRVVIASTTSAWSAYGPGDGRGLYFSNAFFSGLENEQSLWTSYLAGREAVGHEGVLQEPWLDDNGDGRSDGLDGALAAGRALRRVAMGGRSPQIEWVSAHDMIRAKVEDDSAWVGVKVEVFVPSYEPPAPDGSGTTRIVDVPVVTLAGPDGDGVYKGTYAFTETGVYRLVAHAEDAEGNLAMPRGVQVCVGCVYLPLVVRSH